MQNGIGQTDIRRDTPQTSGSFGALGAPARTANYHYAAMRRAEDAARSLSIQTSTRGFLGAGPLDEFNQMKAARDSYYLLAVAHRAAARKRERRENRALAWSAFKEGPAAYIGCMVRSAAYSLLRAVTR
jgi:hypothetical protein